MVCKLVDVIEGKLDGTDSIRFTYLREFAGCGISVEFTEAEGFSRKAHRLLLGFSLAHGTRC